MGGFNPILGVEPHLPVLPIQLDASIRSGKYMQFGRAVARPSIFQYGTQAAPSTVPALPTAVADSVNGITLPGVFGCNYIEMYQTTAQTLMPSVHATKGLEIALDQVDNESVEYIFGGNHAANPLGYLAGTDPGVLARATFEIPNAGGMDQFGLFWRKQSAYVVPTSFLTTGDALYEDFILFGLATTPVEPAPIKIAYDLNNSGSTTVVSPSFTISDSSIVTLEIRLQARVASFFINGLPIGSRISKDGIGSSITAQNTTTVPRITIDSGDFFIPGVFCRQAAGLSPAYLRSFTCCQIRAENPRQR